MNSPSIAPPGAISEATAKALLSLDPKLAALAGNLWRPVPVDVLYAAKTAIQADGTLQIPENPYADRPEGRREIEFAFRNRVNHWILLEEKSCPLARVTEQGTIEFVEFPEPFAES